MTERTCLRYQQMSQLTCRKENFISWQNRSCFCNICWLLPGVHSGTSERGSVHQDCCFWCPFSTSDARSFHVRHTGAFFLRFPRCVHAVWFCSEIPWIPCSANIWCKKHCFVSCKKNFGVNLQILPFGLRSLPNPCWGFFLQMQTTAFVSSSVTYTKLLFQRLS